MELMKEFWEKAKSDIKRIVLPEGEEERTIQASAIIKNEGLAELTLLGNVEKIRNKAQSLNVNIDDIEIIDPETSEKTAEYANEFYELRKSKGVTL